MRKASRLLYAGLACSIMLSLAACVAAPPDSSQPQASLPPVPADKGRIVFYREFSLRGAAVTPLIMIDGVAIGGLGPGEYFFVDEPAGNHRISTSTGLQYVDDSDVTLTISAGETKYIRTGPAWPRFWDHTQMPLETIEPQQALAEIADCHFAAWH